MLPLEEYTPLSKGDALNPDLTEELQYSSTYGTPHFLKWLKEHVQRVHAPKYDDWNILCTAGNTDGTDAVMRACLDRGDHLLVEEFGKYPGRSGLIDLAYPGLLSPAMSLGFKPIGVPMDSEGVNAGALDKIMEEWDEVKQGGPRPKLIVLVP
jgi:aromatic amino acid aminotransferase I